MKTLLLILYLVPVVIISQLSKEQQIKVDSLKKIVLSAPHDSLIINALIEWDNIIYLNDPVLDLQLNQKIDSICAQNLSKNLNSKSI